MYGEIREGDPNDDEGEESKLDATIHAENVSGFLVLVNTFICRCYNFYFL